MNLLEKKGYASEKNLVLKDCILSLNQLEEFREGFLEKKLLSITKLLTKHVLECKLCSLEKKQCSVCKGGRDFYEFEIEMGGQCPTCRKFCHLHCQLFHQC